MSIGISSAAPTGSILAGLQNMQRQMNALSAAAGRDPSPQQQFHVYDAASEGEGPEAVQDGASTAASESSATRVGAFEQALKDAFETVNSLQNNAANLQARFDTGDRQVTLSDVMLATQIVCCISRRIFCGEKEICLSAMTVTGKEIVCQV